MALKHERPTSVFLEVKAAKKKQSTSHTGTQRTTISLTELHLLKTSNASLAADGMLHLGAGDSVGQMPAVRTFTERFLSLSDILKNSNTFKVAVDPCSCIQSMERTRCCHAIVGLPARFGCGTRIHPL